MESNDKFSRAMSAKDNANSTSHPWLRGVLISSAGVVIGMIAFALFCFSLGLNFQDEGWAADRQIHRPSLVGSLVGLAIAILVFWLGFFQTTRR
jgi:hypothetical protein